MSETKLLTRKVSASSLKQLAKCTMQFYLSRYEKLPEKVWPRTVAGSLVHIILECLYPLKHRKHYNIIKKEKTVYASPAIARLIKRWKIKYAISDEVIADIDGMVMLAINNTNFLDEGAKVSYPPEHEFKIQLRNGGLIIGFIDRMAEYENEWIITDWKSQRERFTSSEVADNFQSLMYQLYVWKTFNKLASVRYIMLRHPPTSRTKEKHLQITPPPTPEQLIGFEYYLEQMAELFNNFGPKEAKARYCEDTGFCERVCSYRRPFSYLVVKNKDGSGEERRYWIDPKNTEMIMPYELKEHEVGEIKTHAGCPRFNSA